MHLAAGGRLVPFAGWEMPVQYEGILAEHRAVREHCGIFDISHMGEFSVRGAGAERWLEGLLTNRIAALAEGSGQYTLLCNERGGVIDDLIVYRSGPDEFFLVVNAAKVEADAEWFRQHRGADAIEFDDHSDRFAAMAVQGPEAPKVWASVSGGEELPPRNGIAKLAGGALVCRTGYTGEDGFEFFCPTEAGEEWWGRFCDAGAKPCGLGARDSLRLEMGYPLNGSDLTPERTPLEAGLGFFVDLEKAFVGVEVMRGQKRDGLPERLAAFKVLSKGPPPRPHYLVSVGGEVVGEVCSGGVSPCLGVGIGMAYLPPAAAKVGAEISLDVRGRSVPAEIVKKPIYRKQG